MLARKQVARGFTLVEILIVVVILGILAAIVIPQFTNASETAKASSLAAQLQTVRSQLELYQVQHNGNFPDLGTNWNQVTMETDVFGAVAAGNAFGPYLQQPPSNGFQPSTANADIAVTQVGTGAGIVAVPAVYAATGWSYSWDTGGIKANIPVNVDAVGLGLDLATADYNIEP